MNTNHGKVAQNAGKAGTTHANGFKVAKVEKINNLAQYCMKCGKAKSSHGFFGQCPK